MLVKCSGILNFFPENKTRKHHRQSSWKRTAMIQTGCDIEKYYAWFIEKRFNLKLNQTIRGTHITFINDKLDENIFNQASEMFHGKEATFYYDIEPRSDGKHWWLRVYSQDFENIRKSIGLDPNPYYGFHMTIGHANELNIDHSEYILRQCKRFELISNSPRIPFEDHIIK